MNESLHKEWLTKGDDDYLNARSIITHRDGTPSGVCFLSEQMAEKYLKALLVYRKEPVPKIHDLLRLETILIKRIPDITTLHEYLATLNRYYIETRYPGDYPEFSWQDAQEAFDAANVIQQFVRGQLS